MVRAGNVGPTGQEIQPFAIEPLGRHLTLVSEISRWHWDEWGHDYPESSPDEWAHQLAGKANIDILPATWIALVGDQPVGVVTVELDGVEPQPELKPDVAGLFVLPDYRSRGIGSALMSACEEGARVLGVRTLYLNTEAAEPFYADRDWKTISYTTFLGHRTAIMAKLL